MSIPVLIQTYDEVRRLAIAGSVVAPGDFRLKKLLGPLEQAGQKAPVFTKVGEAVRRLVESDEKSSAPALLELTTLVNAILYTQGETGIEGELAPVKTIELARLKTRASARVLKPLQEALTTKGSGRLEIIRDAYELGVFHDFRLIVPALAALDDVYPEIADFVVQKILPFYGPAIFTELQAAFDAQGRAGHARRLSLMHRLDREAARALVQRSLDEGSKEVRIAAIGCLGDSPEELPFLLEQAKAKAKEVRTAALNALGSSSSDDAAKVLCDALAGADLALAIQPLRTSRNPVVLSFLLDAAEKQFDALVTGKESDNTKLGKHNERMCLILECMGGRDDTKTEKLVLRIFGCAGRLAMIKGEPSGKDVVEKLVAIMAVGPPNVQTALVEAHTTLPAENLGQAFIAACRSHKPAEVFKLFSPYLTAKVDEKKKGRDPAFAKREAIVASLVHASLRQYQERDHIEFVTAKPDPQWLDLAVKLGRVDLVQALAVPGHAGANALLAKLFQQVRDKSGDGREFIGILNTMIRVGHPDATNATIELIKKSAKAGAAYGHYWLGHLIPRLPKEEAVPKLEALLPTLPERMIDQLLGFITDLKSGTP
jgi:hypothetical protein